MSTKTFNIKALLETTTHLVECNIRVNRHGTHVAVYMVGDPDLVAVLDVQNTEQLPNRVHDMLQDHTGNDYSEIHVECLGRNPHIVAHTRDGYTEEYELSDAWVY